MTTKTTVWVTLQVEGIHCWPRCPFEEVAFLRHPHRHMFHIKAWKAVHHDDRDVEFIMFKREIEQWIYDTYGGEYGACNFEDMSCEAIAKVLMDHFGLEKCEVSEDGENGALVEKV